MSQERIKYTYFTKHTNNLGEIEDIEFSVLEPNLLILKKAIKQLHNYNGEGQDIEGAAEIILREGFCGGDTRVLTETKLTMGAIYAVAGLLNFETFEIKKN